MAGVSYMRRFQKAIRYEIWFVFRPMQLTLAKIVSHGTARLHALNKGRFLPFLSRAENLQSSVISFRTILNQ